MINFYLRPSHAGQWMVKCQLEEQGWFTFWEYFVKLSWKATVTSVIEILEHHLPIFHSPCRCRSKGPLPSCSWTKPGPYKRAPLYPSWLLSETGHVSALLPEDILHPTVKISKPLCLKNRTCMQYAHCSSILPPLSPRARFAPSAVLLHRLSLGRRLKSE